MSRLASIGLCIKAPWNPGVPLVKNESRGANACKWDVNLMAVYSGLTS